MVTANDIYKKFEDKLSKVDRANPKTPLILHVFKFVLTDDSGAVTKTWMMDLKNLKMSEANDEAECTVTMKFSTMADIFSGTTDLGKAHDEGQVKVEGKDELFVLLKPMIKP